MTRTILGSVAAGLLAAAQLAAQDPRSLYNEGFQAYSQQRHVRALERLAAYRIAASQELTGSPEFNSRLNAAIAYSEAVLDLALRTRQQLEKEGKVTEVEITVGGKMDNPSERPVKKRIRLPSSPPLQQPTLSSPAALPERAPRGALVAGKHMAVEPGVKAPPEPVPVAPGPGPAGDTVGVDADSTTPRILRLERARIELTHRLETIQAEMLRLCTADK